MSDAIVLDVLSSSPVQLDVGDADPIAREEIAALAERMDTAEGDISTLGMTVDGIDARVEAIEADYVTAEDVMDALGGEAPTLVAGSSRAVLGDTETASWMERTTAADGAALVEAVYGRTLRWNQLYKPTDTPTVTSNGITVTNNGDGSITVSGTSTARAIFNLKLFRNNEVLVIGHKYLIRNCSPANGSASTWFGGIGGSAVDTGNGGIYDNTTNTSTELRFDVATSDVTVPQTTLRPQLFDLTAMFGSGNEPATVAEFEALFPDAYYPYDAGSLLPVRMEGVETVGFNQWDGTWENGAINSTTGQDEAYSTRSRSFYIPVFPNTEYYHFGQIALYYYDSDKNFLSARLGFYNSTTFTTPVGCRFIRFMYNATAVPSDTICINLSDPARNGTYEPHWSSQRTIPAATYFPQGLRSAGTVRDELTETQAITRVGERAYQSGDESDASVITDGIFTHYALATPTTTPIDPPLPLSYRTGAGGTERVMVASGTTSAPPVFVTRYPLDPADLAESIAPREFATAEANHAVGDLVMLGWTLCKVTTAIARGEAITIGTNVTRTSVAAEIAALS